MPVRQAANHKKISYISDGINPPKYISHPLASTHIEDRGYQFSDGVYEVIAAKRKRLIDGELHFKRLKRSLDELNIKFNVSRPRFITIIKELVRKNNLSDFIVYIQITRGIARRNHPFPKNNKPCLVITISPWSKPTQKEMQEGVSIVTAEDIRWGRRDIKSVSLLPNILAKQYAISKNAKETWLLKDNTVTEGSSTNGYIVDKSGTVITHPANNLILGGVTRDTLIRLAKKDGIKVKERPILKAELKTAKEAFITATTFGVLPVSSIDGKKVGSGNPGEVTKRLIDLYNEHMERVTK